MGRPAKRPRLLTPLDSVYNAAFDDQHEYYEVSDHELVDYEEAEEGYDDSIYDPDQELQQKRAQAEFKLKSTFEAIFEKYGKDFEGIGDEIDLRTGEILVNNGHLLEMCNEVDVGDSGRCRGVRRSWSQELDEDVSGSEEDDMDEEDEDDDDSIDVENDDEEDYDDDDPLSGEEMVEDDMILRGFAQASQHFLRREPPEESESASDRFALRQESRQAAVAHPSLAGNTLPSRSDILAKFGPQLGSEIAKFVTKTGVLEDSDIEPAWRVPNIVLPALPAPTRRSLLQSVVGQPEPELERSPSPENSLSIWAVPKPIRKRFSADEDELLLDFVANARRHGLNLSKQVTWKELEATNPYRDWRAWKKRYNTKFTYLRPSLRDESDLSTSETTASTAQLLNQRFDFRTSLPQPASPRPSRPVGSQRPARVRKPAQRDGIISWSEAVAAIASVDPVGNAGLLDDARRTTGLSFKYELPVASSSATFANRRHSSDRSSSKRPVEQDNEYLLQARMRRNTLNGAEKGPILKDPAFYTEGRPSEKAPCPHADCRPYPTTLYRLERKPDEDLSPMCSHLLHVHRIAPFPCGESNCKRKGAQGYFMQRDLVRHVKEVHPYASALHRLRGRVDPALLAQTGSLERTHESVEIRRNSTSGKQPRDSDFMSAQTPYASLGVLSGRQVSWSSDEDFDRTLVPQLGAALDGVSSLHVHPSSATRKGIATTTNSREGSKPQASGALQTTKHTTATMESFVDRSYELSDEEDGIRPVLRRPPPPQQPILSEKSLAVPQSFFVASPPVESPHSTLRTKRPPVLPKQGRSPRSKQPLTIPTPKTKHRKSMTTNVLDSDDFDELSLNENGFILLSARKTHGTLPKSALPVQVKSEQSEEQAALVASTKKRILVDDGDIDELAEDSPSTSTPSSKSRPNNAVKDADISSMRPLIKPKPTKRRSSGVGSRPGSSLRMELTSNETPKKDQQLPALPARINTPLIDFVDWRSAKDKDSKGSVPEIPSTSELGSSPSSQRARTRGQRAAGTSSPLTSLATPRMKTWAGRTTKREDEGDGVVTPGGTLRKCGQDGFVCERAFCFRCRAEDGNAVES